MGASASKIFDSTILLMVSSLEERHSFCEGVLISSGVFLRVFTDVTNHIPPHAVYFRLLTLHFTS